MRSKRGIGMPKVVVARGDWVQPRKGGSEEGRKKYSLGAKILERDGLPGGRGVE